MRLSRNSKRRLERKKNRDKKRVKLYSSMSLAVLMTSSVNSVVNAATIDDFRELMGNQRIDEQFTSEEKKDIIYEYTKIEEHNRVAKLLNSFDPSNFNKQIQKDSSKLNDAIKTQQENLLSSFQSGAMVKEVLSMKSFLENLKYQQSSLPQEKEQITLEMVQNNVVDEYKSVIENTKRVESFKEVGVIGDTLLSPLKTSFVITSPFGYRIHPITHAYDKHLGVDLEADMGDFIYSTWEGIVSSIYTTETGGNTVVVTHDNGLETRYLHLKSILVEEGQELDQYELLGTVGDTGKVTGPHLHFEVYVDGEPVNPIYFFGSKGAKALSNYIMESEDPIVKEMASIIPTIKSAPKNAQVGVDIDDFSSKDSNTLYQREDTAPEGSIKVKLKEGHDLPKPSDDLKISKEQ